MPAAVDQDRPAFEGQVPGWTRVVTTVGGVSIELIIATRRGESPWIHDIYQLI
jgi:hypothetical protein